ncbi:MAG: hypothetical protein ACNA7J_09815 [Wenzhouxiangella sp.]
MKSHIGLTIHSMFFLLGLGLTLNPAIGQDHMHDDAPVGADDRIGTVDFRADCDESVRADFDRALGLMHHMMYVQARSEFESVAEADSQCAMAHWGIATTLFQPLWSTTPNDEEIQRARAAIDQARVNVDSERERLLIEATAAFFEPETDRLWDRLPGWIDGIAEAYQAYPDDLDVAALQGLALLTRAQTEDGQARHALHDEAETILRGVWEQEQSHPGAIHYTIHATDAAGRAGNALEMVDAYGEIAPNVPHALHMPSHIYVRLGDWPSVIDWNIRSAEAALGHEVDGAISFHYIHAIDYLVYGHLQRGEDAVAESIWVTARNRERRHQDSFPGAFHLAAIPARLAVEQQAWEKAAALEPRVPDYIAWESFQWPEGLTWFARGLGAVHTGDLDAARQAAGRLAELSEQAKQAADERFTVYIDADRHILEGWIAKAEGDEERAVDKLRTAVELEASVEKHPVTPGALLPPGEALGNLLLALDRPAEALEAYAAADQTWPGRYNTLFGAARAAKLAGDDQAAARWAAKLVEVAGESKRPTLDAARQLLAVRH